MGIDTKIWLFRGVSHFAILLKKLYNFVFSPLLLWLDLRSVLRSRIYFSFFKSLVTIIWGLGTLRVFC